MSSTTLDPNYVGTFNATLGDGTALPITIPAGTFEYQFCLMDMLRYSNPRVYPALASKQPAGQEWMSDDQARIARLLGWGSVIVIVVVVVIYIRGLVVSVARALFVSTYTVSLNVSSHCDCGRIYLQEFRLKACWKGQWTKF